MACIAIERFCHKKTRGFRPYKIYSTLSYHPEWDIAPPTEKKMKKIRNLLSQPYYFLGSGGQAYAFVSKDQTSVLKLFKHHHMKEKSYLDQIPLPPFLAKLRTQHRKIHLKRLSQIFGSTITAWNRFKKESGLIYLHLNKTDHLQTTVTLFDAIGVQHTIPLDQIEFALQEKATMAFPKLNRLISEGKITEAKTHITSLLELFCRRSEVEILDLDARKRNFGFVGERAIEIDLGSFITHECLKSPQMRKKIFFFESMILYRWIKKHHTHLAEFLEEKIEEKLHQSPYSDSV